MVAAFLIAGLGNPGKSYENTRHNVGFKVLDEIATREHLVFKKKFFLKASIAHGLIGENCLYLMKPESYVNLSGGPIASAMKKYEVELGRLLVIVDDIYLPFGQMRLRTGSGSGGHNGLKSIEERLGTQQYARLRIGVGDRQEGDLARHVLGQFTPEEKQLVPNILERAADVAQCWLTEGLTSAMNRINSSQP